MAHPLLARSRLFWVAILFVVAYEFALLVANRPDVDMPWVALAVPAVIGPLVAVAAAVVDGRRSGAGRRLMIVATLLAVPLAIGLLFWLGALFQAQGASRDTFIPVALLTTDIAFGGLAAALRQPLGRAAVWPAVAGLCSGWAAWVPYVGLVFGD